MTRNNVLSEEAARKRQEIGLSARRATARATVLRPPDSEADAGAPVRGFGGWWLVFFLSLLALTTFLLVAARFLQSPTDLSTVNTDLAQVTEGKLNLQGLQGAVKRIQAQTMSPNGRPVVPRLFDDFSSIQSILPNAQNGAYSQQVIPTEGVYRMNASPGNAAYSLLGDSSLRSFRLETSARIAIDFPQSSAGLIVRFVDANHFYLFAVDGEGRFEVLHANGVGNWQLLLPWMPSNAVNAAGVGNVLEVEDHGSLLRFSVNGTRLFEHTFGPEESTQSGDAGLWTAATGDANASVDFDRIRLEPVQS
ncbi:MAG: hypothetical protein U0175_18215 [Caldilineaceae bacterium]